MGAKSLAPLIEAGRGGGKGGEGISEHGAHGNA
jgi:hypothetical protein